MRGDQGLRAQLLAHLHGSDLVAGLRDRQRSRRTPGFGHEGSQQPLGLPGLFDHAGLYVVAVPPAGADRLGPGPGLLDPRGPREVRGDRVREQHPRRLRRGAPAPGGTGRIGKERVKPGPARVQDGAPVEVQPEQVLLEIRHHLPEMTDGGEGADRRQQVLGVVRAVVDRERVRRPRRRRQGDRQCQGDPEPPHARPLRRALCSARNASRNRSGPALAMAASMRAWSSLDEAPANVSAISPSSRSNSRAPRRDW